MRLPFQSNLGEACGVDPNIASRLPATRNAAATNGVTNAWIPQTYDFWPNVLFDSREGTLRDAKISAANLPTLNGTMHYIELDGLNLANWFGGKINTMATSGQSTRDPNVAPNNYVVYISDRRGNYEDSSVQTITGGWPPLSYTLHETGEYGWNDIVNFSSNPTTGCPDGVMNNGEDPNVGTTFAGQFYYYGASQKYIHAMGAQNTAGTPLQPGQIGVFSNLLTGNAVVANTVCTAVPAYSTTDNIWPMMVAANTNAARENAPLFFRRAVKIVNAKPPDGHWHLPGWRELRLDHRHGESGLHPG